jgi:hypothetical protein
VEHFQNHSMMTQRKLVVEAPAIIYCTRLNREECSSVHYISGMVPAEKLGMLL